MSLNKISGLIFCRIYSRKFLSMKKYSLLGQKRLWRFAAIKILLIFDQISDKDFSENGFVLAKFETK